MVKRSTSGSRRVGFGVLVGGIYGNRGTGPEFLILHSISRFSGRFWGSGVLSEVQLDTTFVSFMVGFQAEVYESMDIYSWNACD